MRQDEWTSNIRAMQRMQVGLRHGMVDLAEESLMRGESDSVFRERLMKRLALRMLGGTFSFTRMLGSLKASQRVDGLEKETLEEAARQRGEVLDTRCPVVPWGFLKRDLTAGIAGSGGFLVETDVGDALDILRPWSVTARAGLTAFENLRGNMSIPRTTAKTTGYWLTAEATQLTESQPSLGQIALTPKSCGALLDISRHLSVQSSVELYVRNELLKTLGTLVDQAVLNGSGTNGEPLGLLHTPDIATQSGTSLAHTGAVAMKTACANANARDEAIAFIATTTVRGILEGRERATGSGFIWDNDRIASRPGYATTDLPAGSLVAGDWADILLALWGPGFELMFNPYEQTKFTAGIISVRMLVSLDVAIGHSTSFCLASSVT